MQTIEFKPSGSAAPRNRYLDSLSDVLSADIRSGADLVALAVERLPADTMERLLHAGLVWDEISFIIPRDQSIAGGRADG